MSWHISIVPAWLLDWHSNLWGKAKERTFLRTVVVTAASYNQLQTKLSAIPPSDRGQIMQIKRNILNALPDDAAHPVETEVTEIEQFPENPVDISKNFNADITFPMRITYVDLMDIKPCHRIPQLVLYRSEFNELTQALENFNMQMNDEAHYQFITGTPGIGVFTINISFLLSLKNHCRKDGLPASATYSDAS
jgi:hypothetical protein